MKKILRKNTKNISGLEKQWIFKRFLHYSDDKSCLKKQQKICEQENENQNNFFKNGKLRRSGVCSWKDHAEKGSQGKIFQKVHENVHKFCLHFRKNTYAIFKRIFILVWLCVCVKGHIILFVLIRFRCPWKPFSTHDSTEWLML